jgi:cytidylate kinase
MINAIGIAGRIASGKSSISTVLASRLGWKRASFGDYVRSIALQRRLQSNRDVLQAIGEELEAHDSVLFCNAVLASVGWRTGDPLVIDGVRHVRILDNLRDIVAPRQLLFVYLEAEDTTRRARLAERESASTKLLTAVEDHSTELDVISRLPGLADLRVSNDDGEEQHLVDTILRKVATG